MVATATVKEMIRSWVCAIYGGLLALRRLARTKASSIFLFEPCTMPFSHEQEAPRAGAFIGCFGPLDAQETAFVTEDLLVRISRTRNTGKDGFMSSEPPQSHSGANLKYSPMGAQADQSPSSMQLLVARLLAPRKRLRMNKAKESSIMRF